MITWHLLWNPSPSRVERRESAERQKCLLTRKKKTGQFEYQNSDTMDIIPALLTFQPVEKERGLWSGLRRLESHCKNHSVSDSTRALYRHIQSPPLHCSALFKLSRVCLLFQCQWKSCFAAHNTSRAAAVIAGARYSISSSCSLWCWAFPPTTGEVCCSPISPLSLCAKLLSVFSEGGK